MTTSFDSRKHFRRAYMSPEAQAFKEGDLVFFCVAHNSKDKRILKFEAVVKRPLEVKVLIEYQRGGETYIQSVKPEKLERR